MIAYDTIRLLIIHDSRAEAERLISMLNSAGLRTRAQYVESEDILAKLLQDQSWDILVAQQEAKCVQPLAAIRQIQRLKKDVVTLIQTDEVDEQTVLNGIKLGAADVIQTDNDQHLLLVIQRELKHHNNRRLLRKTNRKLNEVRRRSQELLDSSRNSVAFVQDGLYRYANQSFVETLGYKNRDDIEYMPVIDMVNKNDHAHVKKFLKDISLRGEDTEPEELVFHAIKENGEETELHVEIFNTTYDEEHCIEFFIRSEYASSTDLPTEPQEDKLKDASTGLYNRQYITDQIQQELEAVASANSAVLYIEIDHLMSTIKDRFGVSNLEKVFTSVANSLQEQTANKGELARFSDKALLLHCPSCSADNACHIAQELCDAVDQNIIDIDDQTLPVTITIGIGLINETTECPNEVLDQALSAHNSAQNQAGEEHSHKAYCLYEPVLSEEEKELSDTKRTIQNALDNDGFQLLFQPIVSLKGDTGEHYEALLRLPDIECNLLRPSVFLDVATRMGAMEKIDRWVITQCLKQLVEHCKEGRKTKLTINLSRETMADESVIPWLKAAFDAADLAPSSLTFQLDEDIVSRQLNIANKFLERVKALGSFVSISNFGCSMNQFKTLQYITCDQVKVHGSFALDIQHNGESPDALNSLIRELIKHDKDAIIPCVENSSILATLWKTGAHYIQGHYLQAPETTMSYDFSTDG